MATVADQIRALGYDSSYGGRSKLYREMGLGGNFSGTAQQNLSLLAALNAGKRPGGGVSAPADPYADFAARQSRERKELLDTQNRQQEGLFGQYQSAISGQEKLPDVFRRLQTEAGIPELRGQLGTYKEEIARVKGLIDRLTGDVNARSEGEFTTEAQRRRIEAKEGGELSTQLGRVTEGMQPIVDLMGMASGDVGTLVGLTAEQQSKELQPLELRINSLSDRFAREMTGFDMDKETELGSILDKLQRDRQLADREWQRAAQLASEEKAFARQKQLIAEEQRQRAEQLKAAGIDPITGRPIQMNYQNRPSNIPQAPANLNSREGADWIRRYGQYFGAFSNGGGNQLPPLSF